MRRYIRHPSDIPLQYSVQAGVGGRDRLKDVGEGGLCFHARIRLPPGAEIHLVIPVGRPPFQADGIVAWCHTARGGFEVGVRFDESAGLFALRMVEQICHIEQYRREVGERQGRRLTSEEAASEWIERFAARFPS